MFVALTIFQNYLIVDDAFDCLALLNTCEMPKLTSKSNENC